MDLKTEVEDTHSLTSLKDDNDKSDASSVDIYSDLESEPGVEVSQHKSSSFDQSLSNVANFINSLHASEFDEEVYNELEKVEIEKKDNDDKECTGQSVDESDATRSASISNDLDNDLDLFSEFLAAEASEKEEKAQKAKEEYDQLKKDNCELKKQKRAMAAQLAGLKHQNLLLKRNISALFRTAREEVQRKDNLIRELREQLDGFNFRRSRLLAVNSTSCPQEKSEKLSAKENESSEENLCKQTSGSIISNHITHIREESANGLTLKDAKGKKHRIHHKHKKHSLKSLLKKAHKGKHEYSSVLDDIYKSSEEKLLKKRQKMLKEMDYLDERDSPEPYFKNCSKKEESDSEDLPLMHHIKRASKDKVVKKDTKMLKLEKRIKKIKKLDEAGVLEDKKSKLKNKHEINRKDSLASRNSSPICTKEDDQQMSLTDFVTLKLFNFIANSPSESLQQLGTTLAMKNDSEAHKQVKQSGIKNESDKVSNSDSKCAVSHEITAPPLPVNGSLKQQNCIAEISTKNCINDGIEKETVTKTDLDCDLLRLQGYRNKVKVTSLSNSLAKLKEMKQPISTQNNINSSHDIVPNIPKSDNEVVFKTEPPLSCNPSNISKTQLVNRQNSDVSISDSCRSVNRSNGQYDDGNGSDMDISDLSEKSCSDMDIVTSDDDTEGQQNIITYDNSYFDIPNSPVLVIEEDKTLDSGNDTEDDHEPSCISQIQGRKISAENKKELEVLTSKTFKLTQYNNQTLDKSSMLIESHYKTKVPPKEPEKKLKEQKQTLIKDVEQPPLKLSEQIPDISRNKSQTVLCHETNKLKTPKSSDSKNETDSLCFQLQRYNSRLSFGKINVISQKISSENNKSAIISQKTNSENKTTVCKERSKDELEEGEIDSDLTDEEISTETNKDNVTKGFDSKSDTHLNANSNLNLNSSSNNNINSEKDIENISNNECTLNKMDCKRSDTLENDTDVNLVAKISSRHHLPPLCSRQTSYRIKH